MKRINYYSDEFKKSVVKQVLSGQLGKEEAKWKYGIRGNSAVLNWIRTFDTSPPFEMKKRQHPPQGDASALEAENRRLRDEHGRVRDDGQVFFARGRDDLRQTPGVVVVTMGNYDSVKL